jgi:hypothetical protein
MGFTSARANIPAFIVIIQQELSEGQQSSPKENQTLNKLKPKYAKCQGTQLFQK